MLLHKEILKNESKLLYGKLDIPNISACKVKQIREYLYSKVSDIFHLFAYICSVKFFINYLNYLNIDIAINPFLQFPTTPAHPVINSLFLL